MIHQKKRWDERTGHGMAATQFHKASVEAEKLGDLLWKLTDAYDRLYQETGAQVGDMTFGVKSGVGSEGERVFKLTQDLVRKVELLFNTLRESLRKEVEASFDEAKGRSG